jgi:uncharacterized membrane protein
VTVWVALVAVLAGAAGLAVAERRLLRRLAGDRRRLDVQRRARRAALWLLALGHAGLAQAAAVAAGLAGASALAPAAGAGPGTAVVAAVVGVFVVVAVVVAGLTRPRLPVLAPGLVTAIAQEVVLRGAVLALLVEAGAGPVTAVGLSSLAFAATRLTRGREPAAVALGAGAVLGAAALVLDSVVVAAAGHATALVIVAGMGDRGARLASAAATAGVGCGGHDPSSPACRACPLAPAAARA